MEAKDMIKELDKMIASVDEEMAENQRLREAFEQVSKEGKLADRITLLESQMRVATTRGLVNQKMILSVMKLNAERLKGEQDWRDFVDVLKLMAEAKTVGRA